MSHHVHTRQRLSKKDIRRVEGKESPAADDIMRRLIREARNSGHTLKKEGARQHGNDNSANKDPLFGRLREDANHKIYRSSKGHPQRGGVARISRRAHNPETGRSNRPLATIPLHNITMTGSCFRYSFEFFLHHGNVLNKDTVLFLKIVKASHPVYHHAGSEQFGIRGKLFFRIEPEFRVIAE